MRFEDMCRSEKRLSPAAEILFAADKLTKAGAVFFTEIALSADLAAPFQKFYSYFFSYDKGIFLTDNTTLTNITEPEDLE